MQGIRALVPDDILKSGDPLVQLLKWFKKDFMQWTPTRLNCPQCGSSMQPSVDSGTSWKLRKTETHSCPKCDHRHIFPRYGEILKIAETRTGRCSEWSMLFGAMLGSLAMPVRIVQDYLDHCWNETLVDGRWAHVDSTLEFPISVEHPHYYEQNWGKKYLHVLAFDASRVEDVTSRYTEQWQAVQQRREKSNAFGFDERLFLPENLQRLYATI